MHTYKLIKRKDNIKYYLGINNINSKTGTIDAYYVKLNETVTAGTINLKTDEIKLADGWSLLPQEVIEAVTEY